MVVSGKEIQRQKEGNWRVKRGKKETYNYNPIEKLKKFSSIGELSSVAECHERQWNSLKMQKMAVMDVSRIALGEIWWFRNLALTAKQWLTRSDPSMDISKNIQTLAL